MHKSIADFSRIIKGIKKVFKSNDFIYALLLITSSLASYTLGIYSSFQKQNEPLFTFYDLKPEAKDFESKKSLVYFQSGEFEKNIQNSSENKTTLFGSKNGTKYYYSWCSGASRIKMQNRVYFISEDEAKSKGRTIAKGCS